MKNRICQLVIINILLLPFCLSFSAVIDLGTVEVSYLFEEGRGKLAKDASPNKRNGSLEGGVKYGPGKFGQGLIYDGKDDNLIVRNYHGISGKNPRTILYWFKSASTREHSWVKWGVVEPTRKYYVRAHVAGGICWLRVENAGGNNWGGDDVCDGNWHHHAIVFPKGSKDVQDHQIYVDGKLNGKNGAANPMDTDGEGQEVVMGDFLAHHAFMHGSFDEVAIFSIALTKQQIELVMNNGLASVLAIDHKDKLSTNWGLIKSTY